MSLTSLQRATLAQLNISSWSRNDHFQWSVCDSESDSQTSSAKENITLDIAVNDRQLPQEAQDAGEALASARSDDAPIKAQEQDSAVAASIPSETENRVIACQLAISSDNWLVLPETAQLDIQMLLSDMEIELTMMIEPADMYQASVAKVCVDSSAPEVVKRALWHALSTS